MAENPSNINQDYNVAASGMNSDLTISQVKKGNLTYALNAAIENFNDSSVNYQNEQGNEHCVDFPEGYQLIGDYSIIEKNKHIFFLANEQTGASEIGYMQDNDCVYRTLINNPCLNFSVHFPIHKVAHRITNCSTEIYWPDQNGRRYLDLENLPYKPSPESTDCNIIDSNEIDCNRLNLQPNFSIPSVKVNKVLNGGSITAGTVQFAIQYSDSIGNGYSSYYSITNPLPIGDVNITTANFDYPVGKSVEVAISNLDVSGQWEYFNLAVINTVNNVEDIRLVGTYFIDGKDKKILYSGQNQTLKALTLLDINERFPYYELADDVTAVQDVLVWKGLTSIDRVNYQKIANKINLFWESYRIPPSEDYSDEINAAELKGYLRDEVYAFEIVFLLKNGKETDRFHIPGRVAEASDLTIVSENSDDFLGIADSGVLGKPRWKIYNTANIIDFSPGYNTTEEYKGPYQYGNFSYWESTELYDCNEEVWGELANKPIRHHKFPDVLISPIFESQILSSPNNMVMRKDAIFPLGVKIDTSQVQSLIDTSDLTTDQKNNIIGYKIIRGSRGTNKSVVAKGILRNVGKYTRDETDFYFPNYPYNDLNKDPFLLTLNNAFDQSCKTYRVNISVGGNVEYTNCDTGEISTITYTTGTSNILCSITVPVIQSPAVGTVKNANYTIYDLCTKASRAGNKFLYVSPITGLEVTTWVAGQFLSENCERVESLIEPQFVEGSGAYEIRQVLKIVFPGSCAESVDNLEAFNTNESKYRHVFNSPETSFGQPFLGNVLKLENVIFGRGKGHFIKVKDHASYRLLTKEAQEDALKSSNDIATLTDPFNFSAAFAAYQSYLTIYINGITRKNYAYSFNSVAQYDYSRPIENNLGIKQREIEIAQYLIPGVQNVGDDININNYNRESSVYIKTKTNKSPLLFPNNTPSLNNLLKDDSRFTLGSRGDCTKPEKEIDFNVLSYYASLKNIFDNQWGQMYSYEYVDTGFQVNFNDVSTSDIIFGGDTFINKFAFKTKLPFFIDNRVGAADDSDIYYDEIGNVAYPKYWFSSRSVLSDASMEGQILRNFISFKAHNFDCPNSQGGADNKAPGRTFYDGKMYLFAYGIPYFYCESSYNLNYRQAFNNREGDFYPHISSGIPDEWLQEKNVSIAQDNTYYYNVTFSKQNGAGFFSNLPVNWKPEECFTYFPFRAIYSDAQITQGNSQVNNWLIYRPLSFFDFPQNYGKLTSLDGIENRAILARFENKSLLYNRLLTIDTSNPQAAYIGNNRLFASAPPVDFAETDIGYVGSQHKFLLKIPQGQITIDAKRGQVFLISGTSIKDITSFGTGMNRFFTENLPFKILKKFPNVNIDNHYNNIGLHGVYDSNYDRVIITKLDFTPLFDNIIYRDNRFYFVEEINNVEKETEIYVTDENYFCNKSFTISYNLNTQSWISFHSYIPNYYIAENNYFYSGSNDCCGDIEGVIVSEILPEPDCQLSGNVTEICRLEGFAVDLCALNGEALNIGCSLDGNTIVLNCTIEGQAQEL